MATVKKSKKKKIIIPIVIVLIIAIVAGSVVVARANSNKEEVTLHTIGTDEIIETVSATGDVSAGASKEYKPATVATCEKVYVKVGDEVQKGDKIADFSTDTLDNQITSLETTYNDAKTSYNNAVKQQSTAKKKLAKINKEIKSCEKKVAKLSKNVTTTKATTTTKKATTTTTTTTTTKRTTRSTSSTTTTTTEHVTYPATMAGAVEALGDLAETISSLSNDIQTTNAITRVVMQAVADAIASGDLSSQALSDAVADAMSKAIKQGIIDETKLIIDSGVAVDMVSAAVAAVDWSAVGTGIAQSDNVQLTTAQLELVALYAQQEIYTAGADGTVANAQKKVMNTSKSALDTLKESQKDLKKGWTASFDGTITECNLVEGAATTALETGVKLENMDTMITTISLGEYDVHKVKVGMKATITTAYGEYTGEVATIAPTATGGSDGSVLDSVGSMAGISGLSSLTSSGAGVECTVTVDNPDENIIIGFDADVEIQTGDYTGVPTVPIESIVLEKEGSYVYLYNEKDDTVTKTKITTGAISDTAYEIKSGLKVGDKIVSTPSSDYEEDTFKVKVTDKKS